MITSTKHHRPTPIMPAYASVLGVLWLLKLSKHLELWNREHKASVLEVGIVDQELRLRVTKFFLN